jgi:hypothetical protein
MLTVYADPGKIILLVLLKFNHNGIILMNWKIPSDFSNVDLKTKELLFAEIFRYIKFYALIT